MADIGGVLGENDARTVGTQTAYTCPSGKWAKVKIMYNILMANTGTFKFTINGIDVMAAYTSTGAEYAFTSNAAMFEQMGTKTNAPDGTSQATTCAPGPYEYYLSAGDTITYTIGVVDCTSVEFQVVGVELDAS